MHARKTAFIVEHDFIMATYLADRVIVYTGTPAVDCTCHPPQTLLSGMNAFLKDLSTTFRRDPTNHRPRINKLNSVKDREQKLAGTYFYLDTVRTLPNTTTVAGLRVQWGNGAGGSRASSNAARCAS